MGLWGPQWTTRDNVLRATSHACKSLEMRNLASLIDRRRVSLPAERENQLYSSAKISLNFHEREDDGTQPHYIVNQRTFKIPACGGFQICDYVPAIAKYFDKTEIVMAKIDAEEWVEKVQYFMRQEDARRDIQERGIKRAQADHMYTNRVELVLKLIRGLGR